ncbi:MAG: hypothetical protein LBE22_07485 [Azoarcus sp.]|jgi:hypothetical protein|nr:hypothetical protein [Azoarcus sp.]
MKKILKFLATTMAGLIVTMLIVGIMITLVGSWVSGGSEQWSAALFSAAPYLLIWRIIVYSIAAGFWYATVRMYQDKGDAVAVGRMKRIGGLGIILILFVELPKLLW